MRNFDSINPITQEKSELLNFFFAYGYQLIGVTNQSIFFKVMLSYAQIALKLRFKDLRYIEDSFAYYYYYYY